MTKQLHKGFRLGFEYSTQPKADIRVILTFGTLYSDASFT